MSDLDVPRPITDPLARTEAASAPQVDGSVPELPPGTRVGRYVILRKLGSGGMGIVYTAFDEELDRRVALKRLQADVRAPGGSGAAVQRLLREAQAMAKLSHPNVVAVFDVGTYQGEVFLAMELVDGLSLRSWREAKPRSVREIVSAYLQAGRGLEAAHAAGILHRDFKPENAIIDGTGRVRVLDFGVARIDDSTPSTADVASAATVVASSPKLSLLTTEGEIVGTPAYMAPEQLQAQRVDSRSDQFAVATVLYEALYRERPFDGATVRELLENILAGRVKPPPAGAKVPRGVRAVLLRALKTKPEERFSSMGEMLGDLERRTAARRTALAAGAALACVATVAGVVALRPARPTLCTGADKEIAAVYGPDARDRIESAIVGSGNPRARDVWDRARPRLDDYAAGWASMRTESCVATRVRGVQSDEALDLRSACLVERQRELGVTVRLLATADAKTVDRAVTMVRELPDLAQCADVAALRTPYAEPKEPDKKVKIDAVRAELAEAAALLRARKNDEAEVLGRKAAEEARALGSRPTEALAWFDVGTSLAARGKDEEARATFLDSATIASSARDDETEARAWTALVKTVGYDLGKVEEGELYSRLAGVAVERAGSKPALRAPLQQHRGDMAYGKGDLLKSEPLYKDALDLNVQAYGDNSIQVARAQIDLADLMAQGGRIREALPIYESSLAKIAAIEGEGSPPMGIELIDYTETLLVLGENDRCVDNARRGLAALHQGDVAHARMRLMLACALVGRGDVAKGKAEAQAAFAEYEATSTGNSPRRATAHAFWSAQLVRRHLCAEAVPEADEAISVLSQKDLERSSLYNAEEVRAICLDRAGHASEGLALGLTALAGEDKENPPNNDGLITALLAVGEGALGTGDASRALIALERGNVLVDKTEGNVETAADVHLALARALVASHGDVARARGLAERAGREYDGTHLADGAAAARAVAAGAR